jgi:hypothetical protein
MFTRHTNNRGFLFRTNQTIFDSNSLLNQLFAYQTLFAPSCTLVTRCYVITGLEHDFTTFIRANHAFVWLVQFSFFVWAICEHIRVTWWNKSD